MTGRPSVWAFSRVLKCFDQDQMIVNINSPQPPITHIFLFPYQEKVSDTKIWQSHLKAKVASHDPMQRSCVLKLFQKTDYTTVCKILHLNLRCICFHDFQGGKVSLVHYHNGFFKGFHHTLNQVAGISKVSIIRRLDQLGW